MPEPKIHIAEGQRYECILCGRCCRRFYVLLKDAEVERLSKLDWGDEQDVPADFVTRIHGTTYFKRRPSGGCVFLDQTTGACRMHARFGLRIKALTCRGYPHNIASTWPGEVSVIARMDCPAVQRNVGPLLTDNRRQIEGLVRELGTRGGFSRHELQGLERPAVETITAALLDLLQHPAGLSPGRQAYAMFLLSERFKALEASFLNDVPTMHDIMPSLLQAVRDAAAAPVSQGIGWFSRGLFREWLAAICRRDEELVGPSVLARCRRTLALAGYLVGGGSFRPLGREHPELSLGKAGLFNQDGQRQPSSHEAWECWRMLMASRLCAPQFFGVAYYGQPFFVGLRALIQTYALVLAAARYHAADRGGQRIEAVDVQYAVGAVDHCLGRSPLLQMAPWRLVEDHFGGRRYGRVLHALGWE